MSVAWARPPVWARAPVCDVQLDSPRPPIRAGTSEVRSRCCTVDDSRDLCSIRAWAGERTWSAAAADAYNARPTRTTRESPRLLPRLTRSSSSLDVVGVAPEGEIARVGEVALARVPASGPARSQQHRRSVPDVQCCLFMTKSWCALAASILGFALFGTACGDGVDGPDNPQNPAGLGPAAVDLGSTTSQTPELPTSRGR